MSLLEIAHLRKSFGDCLAVDDISFHVEAGEVFGLLGPNGAGKSTTMMMLAGLVAPDAGTIRLEGQTLSRRDSRLRTAMGVVPQDLALYPDLTARENLRFFGQLYGIGHRALAVRIDEVLQQTGLVDRAADLVGHYSGGMKRRLNFGVALLHRPRLLILDEPTVGVDPQSRAHLLDCVVALCAEGLAVIYASHYMEEVQAICQRVAVIDQGRMVACGPLTELLGQLTSDVCLHVSMPGNQRLPNDLAEKLQGIAEIRATADNGTVIVISRDPHAAPHHLSETMMAVLTALETAGGNVDSLETEDPSLERLFLQLTGHSLRD